MMNLLALDTATENASVALIANGEIYSANQAAKREHAQLLLPMVDALLQRAGIALPALAGIAFGRGPGSFTGLRVCCSIAKGLAYAHNLPLFPVSSLATLAAAVDFPQVLALMDARMNQVYWAYYQKKIMQQQEQVSDANTLAIAGDEPIMLVGTGIEQYYQQLPAAIQQRIVAKRTATPDAKIMLQLVQAGGIAAVSAGEAAPVYIRDRVVQV